MKIKVYHGGLEAVDSPEIREPNRTLDYGKGFYTTTSFEQAKQWVLRHAKDKSKPKQGFVSVYEIDIDSIREMNTLWFDSPTENWVDFVYSNRNLPNFKHDFDFVYGPVANDRVYAAFALYESGLLNKQDLIKELKTYTLVDQILFHTPKALEQLVFIEAQIVEL